VPGKVYGADDANVTVPVVVKQAIPAVPQNLVTLARTRGLLEVVIDEQGRVISMAIRSSIHPNYDSQLLAAARDWKYQPAKVNGQPVKFRRLIQVTVKK
jgi:TonB family protein